MNLIIFYKIHAQRRVHYLRLKRYSNKFNEFTQNLRELPLLTTEKGCDGDGGETPVPIVNYIQKAQFRFGARDYNYFSRFSIFARKKFFCALA